jgi:GNAT acetyltransferase-like protein
MTLSEAAQRAQDIPDDPGWVDFRGMLLSGTGEVRGGTRHYVILTSAYPVGAVVGKPALELVNSCLDGAPRRIHLVCREESEAYLRPALEGWKRTQATLHVLSKPLDAPAPRGDVRVVLSTTELDGVPDPLRAELQRNLPRCRMVAAWADGTPVSFAYACWETERWFDISVDTLEPYRRRGLSLACVRVLIREMEARRKEPVWGAMDGNAASLNLAARLGFRPVDRIWAFSRPREM